MDEDFEGKQAGWLSLVTFGRFGKDRCLAQLCSEAVTASGGENNVESSCSSSAHWFLGSLQQRMRESNKQCRCSPSLDKYPCVRQKELTPADAGGSDTPRNLHEIQW